MTSFFEKWSATIRKLKHSNLSSQFEHADIQPKARI